MAVAVEEGESTMSVAIVIPARLGSTRLPEKVLADIEGKSMIRRVYEQAKKVRGVGQVIVATDHEKVMQEVSSFGGQAILSPESLKSGSDRVAYASRMLKDSDVFINLQGDEPFLNPLLIEGALELVMSGRFTMATPAAPLQSPSSLDNPNVVKVLVGEGNRAIYFSRFPIPYSRGPRPSDQSQLLPLHHVGVYVYTRQTLMQFASLAPTPLELAESLEQLRALHYGIPIGVSKGPEASIGVDTLEDLESVRALARRTS